MSRPRETLLAFLFAGLILLPASPVGARERTWHIAVEEVDWNYFPEEDRRVDVATLDAQQRLAVTRERGGVGSLYRKVVYRAYSDESFSRRASMPEWQGLLGPTLHAEVGDTLRILLRNNAARPYSLHLGGLAPGSARDAPVPPGETRVLSWKIPEELGPGPADPSSVAWPYFSNVDRLRDTHAGLVGALIVTRKGLANAQGRPADIDRELVVLAAVFDENLSWYLPDNLRRRETGTPGAESPVVQAGNRMPAINGRMFASLPMPLLKTCERVRIYALTLNNGTPGITLRWQGNTLLRNGHRTDAMAGAAGTAVVAEMRPYHPGVWEYGAARAELRHAGMWASYRVESPAGGCR